MLQLNYIALMAGAVKRSAEPSRATATAVVTACWSVTICWMGAVMVVAAVSEYDEGQLSLSFLF